MNKNFIKSQKGVYAKALKRLMQGLALEPEIRTNSYDTARSVAGKAEEARKEILQANATFRLVVQCYSNYLGDFKKTFSSFEKSLAQLNAELDRKSAEASGIPR